jgi:hypothetical protein
MLEAHYQRREGRVQAGWTQAVLGGSRRLRLVSLASGGADPEPGSSDELLDLSSRGVKLRTRAPAPRPGDGILIELRHPEVRGSVSLRGEVRWAEADPAPAETFQVGVVFVEVRDTTAVALERLIALELGSEVKTSGGAFRGYVAPDPSGQRWTLYGPDRVRLGKAHGSEGGVVLCQGTREDHHPDLAAAIAAAFGEEGLEIAPPLDQE